MHDIVWEPIQSAVFSDESTAIRFDVSLGKVFRWKTDPTGLLPRAIFRKLPRPKQQERHQNE